MNEKYIRFDWAMKRMLRDRSTFGRSYPEGLEKANFDVLEGLLTVLFEEQVKIEELLRGMHSVLICVKTDKIYGRLMDFFVSLQTLSDRKYGKKEIPCWNSDILATKA